MPKTTKVKLQLVASEARSFKWEPFHMAMANYLRDNYDAYKRSLSSNRKITFLRGMRESLQIACTDIQLKNGFYHFLKKYTDVRQKLNSSGFGVDPEKDKSLDKGWILRSCPYFEILDEVLGTRPNVTPPCLVSTSAAPNSNGEQNMNPESPVTHPNNEDPRDKSPIPEGPVKVPQAEGDDDDELPDIEETIEAGENASNKESLDMGPKDVSRDNVTQFYVQKALKGIEWKKRHSGETPMGVFAKAIEEKTAQITAVEKDKLELQKSHQDAELKVSQERNEIERLKVNSQIEIERQKLQLEADKIKDRAADREHQIRVLQMQQEFELKKLQLTLQHK